MSRMPLEDKINPAHTALVVIDIQKDFVSPDGVLGRMGRDMSLIDIMMAALPSTIEAAKAAGVPVFYFKQVYDRTKLTSLQLEQYDLDGKLVTCDIAGEGHTYHGIEPDPDMLFVKYNFNIFSHTDFCERLSSLGIKTLVLAGVDTIYCIETAVRNAFDLGYKVVVPKDLVACSGSNQLAHDNTLHLVDRVFGVTTTSAALRALWSV